MATVFLSYSTKDHFFAELASIKLAECGIDIWRDQGRLRAGSDWRNGIERGIAESIAVIVALSEHSAESSYVTFEWAYGLGAGKTVVPVKLDASRVHPRLEPIQYLDFAVPGALPWNLLAERIREIEADATPDIDPTTIAPPEEFVVQDPTLKTILAYLNQRGYQMVSFDRLRRRIDPNLTDAQLTELVNRNPSIVRQTTVNGGKPALAKRVP